MDKNLKIGLAFLIIASVFFLCSTVAFYILKEAEKEKIVYLKEELKDVVEAKESLAEDLDEIKVVNRNLESRLISLREQAERLSEEVAKEKETKRAAASQLEEEKKKSDGLMADIMKEKEERLNLVQKLSKAEEAYRDLREQFELMIEAKETLEQKFKAMMAKKGVELQRIEVRSTYRRDAEKKKLEFPNERLASGRTRSANVMVVNKKFHFVVTNIGKADGVELETELDIYRSGEFVAKTKVEKLYDKMSAATILPGWENAAIREGDQVYISK